MREKQAARRNDMGRDGTGRTRGCRSVRSGLRRKRRGESSCISAVRREEAETAACLLNVDLAFGGGLEEETRRPESARQRRAVIAQHAALVLRADTHTHIHTSVSAIICTDAASSCANRWPAGQRAQFKRAQSASLKTSEWHAHLEVALVANEDHRHLHTTRTTLQIQLQTLAHFFNKCIAVAQLQHIVSFAQNISKTKPEHNNSESLKR